MVVESSGPRSAASAGLFRVPGLFVRPGSKGSNGVDMPDSVWSPTSPLDLKSHLRSSASPSRVGLGLVDALTADARSLIFGGGKTSFLDSIRPFLELALRPNPAASTDEVAGHANKDSEEYTCVIARGANPRTTHILGGETTTEVQRGGCRPGGKAVVFTVEPFAADRPPSAAAASSATSVASGRCRCCMRRLPENGDIFIYKGEKAFCSNECREGYIEEEVDDAPDLVALDHGSSTAFFLGEDW